MIFLLTRTKYKMKVIFSILLFLTPTAYSRYLKPISIQTDWKYNVNFSNPAYRGKFMEKIVVNDTGFFKMDANSLDIDDKSLHFLVSSTGIRFNTTQLTKYFTITDSIFMQSLTSKKTCPGITPQTPSNPNINVLYGYIIQTDTLRIQIINGQLTHVIPVMYDSAKHIIFSYRNYFSKNCETIQLFEYSRLKNWDTNKIEFTGRITTSGTEMAAVDSNGLRFIYLSDYSDVQPCNSSGISINLDTSKLLIRYGMKKYIPPLTTSNSKFTSFLLNGKVFSTTDINSSRIELTKSGIRNVKFP